MSLQPKFNALAGVYFYVRPVDGTDQFVTGYQIELVDLFPDQNGAWRAPGQTKALTPDQAAASGIALPDAAAEFNAQLAAENDRLKAEILALAAECDRLRQELDGLQNA